ncbi:F0F1 ATP synthase subunit epsilon [Acuticoccus sediminis]|uniref:F0F1 ATP synthase subunit epsilon n=1 Tax=Acuticoccus sediminis TaxID=2184697 RepID=UPI001CFCD6FA|nr:F0F1 ATP synthase subunit epsilon [Acuticoccus sediminis]
MRLLITTPTQIVVDTEAVSVRAEDETGSFGILHGHADFLTALTVGVVTWRGTDGARHHCAVQRGVFSVTGGTDVAVATREAVVADDLGRLEREVLATFAQRLDEERTARTDSLKLQMKAIRQIVANLSARPGDMLGHDVTGRGAAGGPG